MRARWDTDSVWLCQVLTKASCINTLRPRQNGHHFADDTFKRIFLKENVRISIKISLKFVPKSPIDNVPALFQIMAWRRPGDKPLSEAMMVSLLTHICVARPQWVNIFGCKWLIHLIINYVPPGEKNNRRETVITINNICCPWHSMTWWRHQNGNIFRVTGHLCGEFTGHRWILHTRASDAELWCFLWSTLE